MLESATLLAGMKSKHRLDVRDHMALVSTFVDSVVISTVGQSDPGAKIETILLYRKLFGANVTGQYPHD